MSLRGWALLAFMPTENIVKLCRKGLTGRVLWGSDYPIPQYYNPDIDIKDYYNALISDLHQAIDENAFIHITETNFQSLFSAR